MAMVVDTIEDQLLSEIARLQTIWRKWLEEWKETTDRNEEEESDNESETEMVEKMILLPKQIM